ncbi:hypothetical protein DOK67_0001104 [Enterococcus sp. DIV0212c]|uniref:hypothetical protein n=1 Tax=Enterococcus sp. DIV0212c TaxID=2230867 RepID=UPI001A9B84AB|nr:hypothetical protein [Enterococcus sp. DIV0212c]MBO1354462.1 hypothetical protein [Enterococcus sp. DIV0212c]
MKKYHLIYCGLCFFFLSLFSQIPQEVEAAPADNYGTSFTKNTPKLLRVDSEGDVYNATEKVILKDYIFLKYRGTSDDYYKNDVRFGGKTIPSFNWLYLLDFPSYTEAFSIKQVGVHNGRDVSITMQAMDSSMKAQYKNIGPKGDFLFGLAQSAVWPEEPNIFLKRFRLRAVYTDTGAALPSNVTIAYPMTHGNNEVPDSVTRGLVFGSNAGILMGEKDYTYKYLSYRPATASTNYNPVIYNGRRQPLEGENTGFYLLDTGNKGLYVESTRTSKTAPAVQQSANLFSNTFMPPIEVPYEEPTMEATYNSATSEVNTINLSVKQKLVKQNYDSNYPLKFSIDFYAPTNIEVNKDEFIVKNGLGVELPKELVNVTLKDAATNRYTIELDKTLFPDFSAESIIVTLKGDISGTNLKLVQSAVGSTSFNLNYKINSSWLIKENETVNVLKSRTASYVYPLELKAESMNPKLVQGTKNTDYPLNKMIKNVTTNFPQDVVTTAYDGTVAYNVAGPINVPYKLTSSSLKVTQNRTFAATVVTEYFQLDSIPDLMSSDLEIGNSMSSALKATGDLIVYDNRISGGWVLKMKPGELIDETTRKKLAGQFVYVDQAGVEHPSVSNAVTTIEKGKGNKTNPETSVTDLWVGKTGLYFKMKDNNYLGKYAGEIEWILENSP